MLHTSHNKYLESKQNLQTLFNIILEKKAYFTSWYKKLTSKKEILTTQYKINVNMQWHSNKYQRAGSEIVVIVKYQARGKNLTTDDSWFLNDTYNEINYSINYPWILVYIWNTNGQ